MLQKPLQLQLLVTLETLWQTSVQTKTQVEFSWAVEYSWVECPKYHDSFCSRRWSRSSRSHCLIPHVRGEQLRTNSNGNTANCKLENWLVGCQNHWLQQLPGYTCAFWYLLESFDFFEIPGWNPKAKEACGIYKCATSQQRLQTAIVFCVLV